TGVTFTGISTILAARVGGYIAGTIVGAAMQKIVKRYPEALLAVAFFIASVVVFVTPYIGSLLVLSILFFCQGGTSFVLAMWDEHASTPLNTVNLGFGFGAVLANILVAQFLDEGQIELSNSNLKSTMETFSFSSSTNIKIPYSITASLCLLIIIGHMIFAIYEHRTRRQILQVQQVNYTAVNTTHLDEAQADCSEHSPQTQSFVLQHIHVHPMGCLHVFRHCY
ncbi:unnamed protein product, partial [Rotaria sordida]